MLKRIAAVLLVAGLAAAGAQAFTWPENYHPTAGSGGTIHELSFGDITTLNPYLTSSGTETSILGMYAGPPIVNRDWLGTRAFKTADGSYFGYWAKDVQEVRKEQEFVVTLRQGWTWSDGVEMTADDVVASYTILGDPDVGANDYVKTVVDDVPVEVEKLGTYQFRLTLPTPQVNALANYTPTYVLPAHVFMPVYEKSGADGVKAMWGVDTPVDQIVSGGPYQLTQFRPGERLVMKKNPTFGDFVKAADGSPMPGPDGWDVTITADQNAELSLVVTGQASFYWPKNLDQVRAVQQAVQGGKIPGTFYPNLSPSTSVDFITYNFNNTDSCKQGLFRATEFRQAMSLMIDREALVEAALGGLGFPAEAMNTDAAAPFVPDVPDFEFAPERGVDLLSSIGFTSKDADGVLMNPDTGCRVEFDLQFNSGNNRRAQQALVISQTAAEYGVKINPREVSTDIWQNSILGDSLPRKVDYDAQIWGLSGGDVDNPSSDNVLPVATNLNAWNKDASSAQPWEVEIGDLTTRMNGALDLDQRLALFQQRAKLMRQYLPLTPTIAQAFHYYFGTGNVWPKDKLDAVSIQEPYNPGNYRENVVETN